MPKTFVYKLHDEYVLWPEQRSHADVRHLKATTDPHVWAAGYQGNPTADGVAIFSRNWWIPYLDEQSKQRIDPNARYDPSDTKYYYSCLERYIAFDTATKDNAENDWTAYAVIDLLPDYRCLLRSVGRDKIKGAYMDKHIQSIAAKFNADNKLRGVYVEDASSGTIALQTLYDIAPEWLTKILFNYSHGGKDKKQRARRITPFCANGMVLLPEQSDLIPWYHDFTKELFDFPLARHDDMVDAFVMAVTVVEKYLSDGMVKNGKVSQHHPSVSNHVKSRRESRR